jgi:hypothetical protein
VSKVTKEGDVKQTSEHRKRSRAQYQCVVGAYDAEASKTFSMKGLRKRK